MFLILIEISETWTTIWKIRTRDPQTCPQTYLEFGVWRSSLKRARLSKLHALSTAFAILRGNVPAFVFLFPRATRPGSAGRRACSTWPSACVPSPGRFCPARVTSLISSTPAVPPCGSARPGLARLAAAQSAKAGRKTPTDFFKKQLLVL